VRIPSILILNHPCAGRDLLLNSKYWLGNNDLFFRLDPLFQGDDDPGVLEKLGSTPSPTGEACPALVAGGAGVRSEGSRTK
jgi:hypothetical protein